MTTPHRPKTVDVHYEEITVAIALAIGDLTPTGRRMLVNSLAAFLTTQRRALATPPEGPDTP